MIADHRRNLGRVGKIETLPILQICPRSSQTIGDIYDFQFSLVGKIWDGRETEKSQTVWDFPDIWKPGFSFLNSRPRLMIFLTFLSRMKPSEVYMRMSSTLSVEIIVRWSDINRTQSPREGRDAQKSSQNDLETEKSVKWNQFRIVGKLRVSMELFHHFREMDFLY